MLFFGGIITVISCRDVILRQGVSYALHHWAPEISLTYQNVKWEEKALVLQNVHLEEKGYILDIEEAMIHFEFDFSPFSVQPQFSLINPLLDIRNYETSASSSFALLPCHVPQGQLLYGDETLFFA